MNEWEFTSIVAGWINSYIERNDDLPFKEARVEHGSPGSRKRNDLTLFDKNGKKCLTGEIKLPFRQDGITPYANKLVQDARRKAVRAGARFFFTWNVNEFVLWETTPPDEKHADSYYLRWKLAEIERDTQLEVQAIRDKIGLWIYELLYEVAAILRGTSQIEYRTLDEKFVASLEAALHMPIRHTLNALHERYKQTRSRNQLDAWMRDEQGWTILRDPAGVNDNLERAARFACYSLVNKLVFYEALTKRFEGKPDKLVIKETIDTAEALQEHIFETFDQAIVVTNDYETVFGRDYLSLGNLIPFYTDEAVPFWRDLINQIHEFDFSKLDYEIIGNIFERLISPEERHKFGQYYTRVEVVDLINSFCIREGNETVMDPACGGGTFLVRAYARKKLLQPSRMHNAMLQDLYGTDISHFATHLTTINLATRRLVEDENYPRIARSDFFNCFSGKTFLTLPKHVQAHGLGKVQKQEIRIPELDAVVGNPPYIRQEEIPRSRDKKEPTPGTKEQYHKLVHEEAGINLSGRSDIHCYFWPHAASFLKANGWLCLLTSSQWLDVEYGFKLQEWMLRNFEIVALFESLDEPWFVGARVATTITILRKQQDEQARMNNIVRFVLLRRPIRDILGHDNTTAGAIRAANSFRDDIMALETNTVTQRYRACLVPQHELWSQGVQLGVTMGKSIDNGSDNAEEQDGDYYGGKWGVHLRAPDIWFQIIDEFGDKLVPLGEVAEIHRGITSGKDCFFFPKDMSEQCLAEYPDDKTFKQAYGVPRKKIENGLVKLVACGEGYSEIKPIESKYLEPEVHSLMEITSYSVSASDCKRMILLISENKNELKGKYALSYILWGESRGFHKGSTCSSRQTNDKEWYDLTGHDRGVLFWSMAQQYKHVIAWNSDKLICNHNLFDITGRNVDNDVFFAILNSTITLLSKYQYGRPVGVEGNLKTEVIDTKMALVPNPMFMTPGQHKHFKEIAVKLKNRKALQFLSEKRMRRMAYEAAGKTAELAKLSDQCELDMDDRWELDDAVLQLLGVRKKQDREFLLWKLYKYMRQYFEWVRVKEERAIENKKRTARQGEARPAEIAGDLFNHIAEHHPALLKAYPWDFVDKDKPFTAKRIPEEGVPKIISDIVTPNGVMFIKGKKLIGPVIAEHEIQARLIEATAAQGYRRSKRFPLGEDECLRVYNDFMNHIARRDKVVNELIEERTSDEDLQDKIKEYLLARIRQGK